MEFPVFDFKTDIVLENDGARLEPFSKEHITALSHIAQANKGLLKYSPNPIEPRENFEKYMQAALDLRKNNERYTFTVFDKRKNEIAGSTSFLNISNTDRRLEIGATWIGRNFQSTGLNKCMKFLMLQFAFEKLQFIRVEFRVHSKNLQSRKAVEKIGGIYEGELRSHMHMPDGSRRDTVYYSILQEEWPHLKSKNFIVL